MYIYICVHIHVHTYIYINIVITIHKSTQKSFDSPESRYFINALGFGLGVAAAVAAEKLRFLGQVCCSVLQCVAVCCSVLHCVVCVLQCVAVCCNVVQCVAAAVVADKLRFFG